MKGIIDLTYLNSIFISLIFFFFSLFLSPFHLSTYFTFSVSKHRINLVFSFFFIQNRFQLLQRYDRYTISRLILYIQIMRNDKLVISSYYGLVHFFFESNPRKKPTSHTLSIAIISNQLINGFLFNLIEIEFFIFVLI